MKTGDTARRNRTRVCVITTAHPVFDSRIFHRQAKSLASAGFDVRLVAQHDQEEVVDGVRIIPLPRPRTRIERILLLPPRALVTALRQRAGVYHFHDPELLPVGVALRILTRAAVIYDSHEEFDRVPLMSHWLPTRLRRPVAYLVGVVEPFLARRMSWIIAAAEVSAERFPPARTTVIHNYASLGDMASVSKQQRDQTALRLTYTGLFRADRGIRELVTALSLVPNALAVRLTLAGKFLESSLEEEVKALPGFERVDWEGWVPFERMFELLGQADVGCVLFHPGPIHMRAEPRKLFEYLSAGLPVLASDLPLWREIVERWGCGVLVDPTRPEDIARGIEFFAGHAAERLEMGTRAAEAAQQYSWEREASRLVALYDQMARLESPFRYSR